MIIDRTWNKFNQTLTISYCDKDGKRKFYNKQFHHWTTYEYDENGTLDTWNGKKCKKVFKEASQYTPNDFDILEFLYQLPKDFNELLHKTYSPQLYTFDIETEVSNDFPDAELAEQRVTSISVVSPNFDVIVYGLKNMSTKSVELFKERYLQYIEDCPYAKKVVSAKNPNGQPKVLFQWMSSEQELLKHFFTKIVPNVPCLGGWNSYRFDWQYLVNRLKNILGKEPAIKLVKDSSPTKELGFIRWAEQDGTSYKVIAPKHTAIVDYMELVKQYDYVIQPKDSYSLDWISNAAFDAHKVKYDGTLQQLWENDPEWYYFYNAVDSLLVQLINSRLKCIEAPSACSGVTLVPLLDAMGQIALTNANIFEEFYNDGKHVVYNRDEIMRVKKDYQGAFVGCVSGRYSWNVCDDFASLYPSQIITCNLSFENFIGSFYDVKALLPYCNNDAYIVYGSEVYKNVGTKKNPKIGEFVGKFIDEEAIAPYRNNPDYFVSVMGNVYRNNKDFAFRRMQSNKMKLRGFYKYTGQRLESELITEIDNILQIKNGNVA